MPRPRVFEAMAKAKVSEAKARVFGQCQGQGVRGQGEKYLRPRPRVFKYEAGGV